MEERTTREPERGGGGKAALLVAIALVLLAGAAWFLWPSDEPPPPPPPPPAAALPAEPPPAPAPEAAPAPPRDPMALLRDASAHAAWRRWIGMEGLVRRWAIVTDNVAEGVTPRKQLGFLEPEGPFAVERRGGRTVISPRSYARYDGLADVAASLDARSIAAAYRGLHPLLEAAWRGLGYPDGSFDRVTARAIRRIVAAPVREGEVEVVDEGGVFLHADPELERLPEVEKHLLRMGPRNARILQAKAREIRDALGLPAEPGKGR